MRFIRFVRISFSDKCVAIFGISGDAAHVRFCALVFRSNVPECEGHATGTGWVEVLHLPRYRGVSRVK